MRIVFDLSQRLFATPRRPSAYRGYSPLLKGVTRRLAKRRETLRLRRETQGKRPPMANFVKLVHVGASVVLASF